MRRARARVEARGQARQWLSGPARAWRFAPMADTLKAGLSKEAVPVTIDSPVYSARIMELGEITVAFETIKADVDTAPIFRGLPDDRCPCPHWGLVVRGLMTMSYGDRDEVYEAGEVFYNPAGH